MLLGKYFRREKFTYWFLTFLAVILVTELWFYFVGTNKLYGEIKEVFNYLLWPLSLMTSGILFLVQSISCLIYLVRWCKLTPEQKQAVRDAADNAKKTGRILQSEEVLIYYGMFSKKILLRKDIVSMERVTNTSKTYVRGGSVVSKSDYILVRLKSGKKTDLTCSIKVLDGYQGELPWNGMAAVVLLGVAVLVMGIYPFLIDCFMGKRDIVERALFYAGYDWAFWLAAVVVIAVFGIWLYRVKERYNDESYKGAVTKSPLLFWTVIIFLLFCSIFFRDKYEDSELARADLKAYTRGQYEQKILLIRNQEEAEMWGCGSNNIQNYLDTKQTAYTCLKCLEDGEFWEEYFLLIDSEDVPEIEQTYRLYYLENTKIILRYEKVSDEILTENMIVD